MTHANSHNLKDEVISLVKKLPDDVTLDEIMHHLYVKRKIMKGKEDLQQGRSYTQEEIEEMAKKW